MAKKILMILGNALGPHPRAMKEIHTLIATGHSVCILEWDRKREFPRHEVLPGGVAVERIQVASRYGIPGSLGRLVRFFLSAAAFNGRLLLKLLDRDFDVLWIHDFDTLLPGVLAGRLRRKRIVYDIHDLYFSFVEFKGVPNLASRTIRLLEALFMKRADYVLVACRAIGGRSAGIMECYACGSEGGRRRNIEVLWNYPLAPRAALETPRSRKFTIGYIGPLRNCDAYLSSVLDSLRSHRRQVTLLFVDYGSEIDKFKKLAAERYDDLDIRFVPRVPYDEAKKYFLLSDVVILSLYPAFALKSKTQRHTVNMKYFEAASLGVPCIAWADTLSADFVRRYGNGFVFDQAIDMTHVLENFEAVRARARSLKNEFLWDRQKGVVARAVGSAA